MFDDNTSRFRTASIRSFLSQKTQDYGAARHNWLYTFLREYSAGIAIDSTDHAYKSELTRVNEANGPAEFISLSKYS